MFPLVRLFCSSQVEESDRLPLDIEQNVQQSVHIKRSKDGLLNIRALSFLCLWYMFSAGTLFSNKYILSTLNSNPSVLGGWLTAIYGQVRSGQVYEIRLAQLVGCAIDY